MSTFGGLHRAYSGLSSAQRAMEVAGQNIANVDVAGYTRQRVETASVGAPAQVGRLSLSPGIGQGVTVVDIARLGNAQLDARVRGTAALAGHAESYAAGMHRIEEIFREPGDDGLSALLGEHWTAWEQVASSPGDPTAATVLIESSRALADRFGQMHAELTQQYRDQHRAVTNTVSEVNSQATALAQINRQIAQAGGTGVNELLDQRDQIAARLSELTGAEARFQANGTADMVLGGTHLVSGSTARSLEVQGSSELSAAGEVQVTWSHRDAPGNAAHITSGEVAGSLALLAGPEGSGGSGSIAQTAAALDAIAADMATRVNEAHQAGVTVSGESGGAFWSFDPASPAASLRVAVNGADEIAAGLADQGALDGSNASLIAGFAQLQNGPDVAWQALVSGTGATVRNASLGAVNAHTAHLSAVETQRSHAGVSLDEENLSLLQNQHAYQGAARVMTAIDQMLDTLINRTGVVGR